MVVDALELSMMKTEPKSERSEVGETGEVGNSQHHRPTLARQAGRRLDGESEDATETTGHSRWMGGSAEGTEVQGPAQPWCEVLR